MNEKNKNIINKIFKETDYKEFINDNLNNSNDKKNEINDIEENTIKNDKKDNNENQENNKIEENIKKTMKLKKIIKLGKIIKQKIIQI